MQLVRDGTGGFRVATPNIEVSQVPEVLTDDDCDGARPFTERTQTRSGSQGGVFSSLEGRHHLQSSQVTRTGRASGRSLFKNTLQGQWDVQRWAVIPR